MGFNVKYSKIQQDQLLVELTCYKMCYDLLKDKEFPTETEKRIVEKALETLPKYEKYFWLPEELKLGNVNP